MKPLLYVIVLAVVCCVSKGTPTGPAVNKMELRPVRMGVLKKSSAPNPALSSNIQPVAGCTVYRLDSEEKERLVYAFNHIRRRIAKGRETRGTGGSQPMASNMERMGYDTQLEAYAHRFTEKCDPYFDQDVSLVGYHDIGAAVLYHTSSDFLPPFNLSTSFEHNYDGEVVRFNGNDATKPFTGVNSVTNEDVRPYAVFVNHDTRSIGCSQSTFFDFPRQKYVRLAVCYYANGYTKGKPLYNFGPPCADAGRFMCDDGLIVRDPGYFGDIPEPPSDATQSPSTDVSTDDSSSPPADTPAPAPADPGALPPCVDPSGACPPCIDPNTGSCVYPPGILQPAGLSVVYPLPPPSDVQGQAGDVNRRSRADARSQRRQ